MALKSLESTFGMYLWKSLFKVGFYPIDFFFLHFSLGLETADTPIKLRLHSKSRAKTC